MSMSSNKLKRVLLHTCVTILVLTTGVRAGQAQQTAGQVATTRQGTEAQGGASITGSVVDQNGSAILNATVRALNLGSSREVVATTDASGNFQLNNLPPGSYRISVASAGFATAAESITLGENETPTQNFTLVPGAIEDTVTVTAGKGLLRVASETPQTVTVTTLQEIEQRRPRSTFEAIERAPNLIVRETNPARERPRLRGLDSSRVLIVIDGERLNNSRTDLQTGLSPSIIDVTQLESAEVVAGAGSSLYGSDSLAGTINLVTKAPERPDSGNLLSFRLDGTYYSNGQNRRGAATVNYSNPKFAIRANGSQFRLENYSIGNEAITRDQALAIGNFYTQFVPFGSSNTVNTFPIFDVPAGGEILNGEGHGFNAGLDAWVFPSDRHSLRYRQINSQHYDLGDAFSGPPYETQFRFNAFRQYSKYGLRYEGLEFSRYIPRVSVNFYGQKLSSPQSQFDHSIIGAPTSSFFDPPGPAPAAFTGNTTQYLRTSFLDNKNSVTSYGFEAQTTLAPTLGLLITTGYQYLRDDSQDEFFRYTINPAGAPVTPFTQGASSPNTRYTDNAFFLQGEYDRIRFVRLSAGLRIDNWRTNAQVTQGFPLGNEFAALNAATPSLTADPGSLASQVESLVGLQQLAAGREGVESNNTSLTGNFGVVFRLPGGVNPYLRVANSYREPSITERYILRIFPAFPGLNAIVVGNPNLESETGVNYDVGLKVQRNRFNGSLGYFRNNLSNLVIFQTPSALNICVAANAASGLLPLSAIFAPLAGCAIGQSAINFNGRINQADNLIQGVEATGEASVGLGAAGSLTPFASLGYLKGTNKSPTPQQLNIIRGIVNSSGTVVTPGIFNRDDTPIELEGSETDVPLGNITPFRGIFGLFYTDRRSRFFAEYTARHQSQIKRANPTTFLGPTLVNYGTFASLNSFTKQTLRGGYNFRRENYRLTFTAGIDNLTDRTFWEHFQNSPAPGRSFVFGFTTEFFNLLRR